MNTDFTNTEDYLGKEIEWKKANVRFCITCLPGSAKEWYEKYYGPIPQRNPPYWLLHKCDNKACRNPKHLFLGTSSDNTRDWWRKHSRPGSIKGYKGVPKT